MSDKVHNNLVKYLNKNLRQKEVRSPFPKQYKAPKQCNICLIKFKCGVQFRF